jgi:hypothetical protein
MGWYRQIWGEVGTSCKAAKLKKKKHAEKCTGTVKYIQEPELKDFH